MTKRKKKYHIAIPIPQNMGQPDLTYTLCRPKTGINDIYSYTNLSANAYNVCKICQYYAQQVIPVDWEAEWNELGITTYRYP